MIAIKQRTKAKREDRRGAVQRELEQIRRKNGGVLIAEKVVAFARNKRTALHGEFCWDDSKAADQFRLLQARKLIQVYVTVAKPDTQEVRAYVSLTEDRVKPGGGYRHIVDVMTDAERRQALLDQALREFRYFREKYGALKELAPLFEAADRIAEEVAT